MSELDENLGVRIGIIEGFRLVTEKDIMGELESFRMGDRVEAIFLEKAPPRSNNNNSARGGGGDSRTRRFARGGAGESANNSTNSDGGPQEDDQQQQEEEEEEYDGCGINIVEGLPRATKTGKPIQWIRIFMRDVDSADVVAAEFSIPDLNPQWKVVAQRLPIVDHFTQTPPTKNLELKPVKSWVPQVVTVETQEGYIPFMTTELFYTQGLSEYLLTKEGNHRIVRRQVCKHFDPATEGDCRFGDMCTFLHIHAKVIDRLLVAHSFKARLRIPRRMEDIQLSAFEMQRRDDTLMVRDLAENIGQEQLEYMFSGCAGFASARVRLAPVDNGRRYGVLRFQSRQTAVSAMVQTFGSGLSLGFYGVLEDMRASRIKEVIESHKGDGSAMAVGGATAAGAPAAAAVVNRPGASAAVSSAPGVENALLQVLPPARGVIVNGSSGSKNQPLAGQRHTREESPGTVGPARHARSLSNAGGDNNSGDANFHPSANDFPPLPEGWDWGHSRRQNRYYFHEKRGKTVWLHPVTGKSYSAVSAGTSNGGGATTGAAGGDIQMRESMEREDTEHHQDY